MKLYIVRNNEGEYLGKGAHCWVKEPEKARFWPRIGPAKGACAYWKRRPWGDIPKVDIVEFDLDLTQGTVVLSVLKEEEEL
jgi:hypothetical protein